MLAWLSTASTAGIALAVCLGAGVAGCSVGGAGVASTSDGRLQVVVAENDWGSIAAQVGGDRVDVTSIITNPNADPHAYEPTTADGRLVADADLVWFNGIGYDDWMPKLLAADPGGRAELDVGAVLDVADGGNPHRWYDPANVRTVVARYVQDLSRLAPGSADYFRQRAHAFETQGLRGYDAELAHIRSSYAGTPVGASESIVSMLAPALGLRLVTPEAFLRAVSEGGEVAAADKATIDRQIQQHQISIYIYNSQNTTPDVQSQIAECKAAGIPTATITETLVPPDATYQAWQARQLRGIAAALALATGR